ncbi:WhiB family transcriptional regulator [Nocardia sp. NPDC049149]|uniref:WhiB family transcriptional regulator n=1 Tax=Nocardia sp. NPDC049149 TaxID=3364315 RepID=UPI003723F6C5
MNWRHRAACRGAAPGVFHPAVPPKGDPRQALAYCRRCPVVINCAAHALQIAQQRGIVAGVWLDGDREGAAVLRNIAAGQAQPRRCVKCWRTIHSARPDRTCALCGFAEIPV